MPTISIDQTVLRSLIENRGRVHDIADMAERLPLIGCDIDTCNDEVLDVEIFPDRPDLLSCETLFHSVMPFLHNAPPMPHLAIRPGTISMTVDSELEKIRPVILGAVVRGLEVDEGIIKRLMEHQEKLHFSLGRRRKRSSIGVHDLSKLSPPFKVVALSLIHI